jgi:hypothetical protein
MFFFCNGHRLAVFLPYHNELHKSILVCDETTDLHTLFVAQLKFFSGLKWAACTENQSKWLQH